MRKSVTLALSLAALLAAALALAGCTSTPQRPAEGSPAAGDAGAAATPEGPYDPARDPLVNPPSLLEPMPADPSAVDWSATLYRNLDGNPASLNPMLSTSTYEQMMSGLLFDGFFLFDAKLDWAINHDVVDDYQESPDHLQYTVRMKPGLKWQDGEPWTAEDSCFSWEQLMDERVPVPAQRNGPDQIERCEVLDPLTVRFTCKQALPTNIWNINFTIIPKHLYEKDKANHPDLTSGDYYTQLNRAPVGNGPYKFVRWLENDKIEVERWDDYHGDKPAFARQVLRIIPDANILMLSFTKGDVDEFRMTAKQFATQSSVGSDFAKSGGLKVLAPQWQWSYIAWNEDGSNPFFGDVRVRKAMTHACDIPRMIRDLTFNLYTPCTGIFHPDSWMAPHDVTPLSYDLDEAARLLDEAGWKVDTSRDGWRYKGDTKFEFTLLIPQGSALGVDLAAIFQEDLQSIGVQMKTSLMEWATFSERVRKHEFQASTAAWGTGVDPDTSWNLWHSTSYVPDGSAGRNYGGFKNARVDELFQQGREEFDRAKRAEIYAEIARLIYDDQPYTFLFYRPTLWALDSRIHGVTTSPRGVFGFTPAELAWWTPAARDGAAKP